MKTVKAKRGFYATKVVFGVSVRMWGLTEARAKESLQDEIDSLLSAQTPIDLLDSISNKGDTLGIDIPVHRYEWLKKYGALLSEHGYLIACKRR